NINEDLLNGNNNDGLTETENNTTEVDEEQDNFAHKNEGNSEQGDYDINLSGEIKEADGEFVFEGKSNLLPNPTLIGVVIVDDGETVFSETTTKIEEDVTSNYLLQDGMKYFRIRY